MKSKEISSAFPFEGKYLEVLGSKMHYVDVGRGDPILFLHGNPTSSYLWRNIIPYLSPLGRCIAPDLIGMGKSDKPNIAYRFKDHYQYLESFISQLGLRNITLVIHDWGSGLGFHYASLHETNIKGIAFMEAIVRPAKWSQFPKDFKLGFKMFRTPVIGWFMISVMNVFVKKILPQATIRALTDEEMTYYEAPYLSINSRKPIRQWPCEIPINGKPAAMFKIVSDYMAWLQKSSVPKLMLHANPGGLITEEVANWCKQNFRMVQSKNIGRGLHYVQESHPHEIGQAIADWYRSLY